MRFESIVLWSVVLVSGATGCSRSLVPAREPAPIVVPYECRIPADCPRVAEFQGKDQKVAEDLGWELFSRNHRDGWFECIDRFIAGEITLSGPEPQLDGGQEASWSAKARSAGFHECFEALRRAANGDETTLRAEIKPPAWYERLDGYIDEEIRRIRRENDESDLWFANDFDNPPTREQAMLILLRTVTFTETAVGIAGAPSQQCYAFRVVLDQPDAAEAFRDLLRRGQLAGQLFALCGLYLTDRPAFDVEVERYRHDDREVTHFAGCSMGVSIVNTIVDARGKAEAIDILGGGYPAAFAQVKLVGRPLGE